MNRLLALCLTAFFVFVGAPWQHALAQTAAGSTVSSTVATVGTLRGQVADPSGAVIPQASLTVTSAAGVSRTGTSDASGQYAISGLAPGQYTVTVEATGFSTFTSPPVRIAAGQTQHLNVSLTIQTEQ